MLKIDKTIKVEIEGATGQTIPDPQSSEFEAFYKWLVRKHPELAQKLEGALQVTEPYPEEAAQKQAQRREGIAHTIQRMFYKRVWGKRVLNRRALSLTIFFLIFGVMMTSWSFTFFRKPSRVERVEQQEVPPVQQRVNDAEVASAANTPPNGTNLLVVPEVKTVPSPGNVTQDGESSDRADATPPLTLPGDGSSRPLEVPPVPQSTPPKEKESGAVSETSVLATNENEPAMDFKSSVKLFEPPELATQPVLINSSETTPEQNAVLAFMRDEEVISQSSVVAQSPSSKDIALEIPSPELRDASNEPKLAASPALAFDSQDTSTQLSQNTESTPQVDKEETSTDAPPELRETNPTEGATTAQTSGVTNNQDKALLETEIFNGKATELLKPGTLVPATLQKDIILTEGETRQVLADAVDDWCGEESCPALRWLGTATLSDSGRLDVTFERAILDGEILELSGIAYGIDNAEGLPAHLADTTPTLLADLLRAGAGGMTDYVEGQANRQTITRNGETTVTEENVPGVLEVILGRAAGTLQIPEGETGVIRLAAVEKGTRLEVLYLDE